MARTPKSKTPDGVVKIMETAEVEAISAVKRGTPLSAEQRARKNDAARRPRKHATATASKEQMFSVEDAAIFLSLSEARVRGLMRAGVLKVDRVSIATDEDKRKRTAARIRKSVLEAYKEARALKDAQAEQRKAVRVNRTPRAVKPKQFIVTLTLAQVATLEQLGYQVTPRFGGRAINGESDEHQQASAA